MDSENNRGTFKGYMFGLGDQEEVGDDDAMQPAQLIYGIKCVLFCLAGLTASRQLSCVYVRDSHC